MTDAEITAQEQQKLRDITEKFILGEIDAKEFITRHSMILQWVAERRYLSGDRRGDDKIRLDYLTVQMISLLTQRYAVRGITDIDYAIGVANVRYMAMQQRLCS